MLERKDMSKSVFFGLVIVAMLVTAILTPVLAIRRTIALFRRSQTDRIGCISWI
jgi:hypothetical protein